MSADIFACHNLGEVQLASNGWRPGMLLDSEQDSPPQHLGGPICQ